MATAAEEVAAHRRILDAIDAGGPVFVTFSGSWCASCRSARPFIEAAAAAHAAEAQFFHADVAVEEPLARECGVSKLPAVAFFRDGDDQELLTWPFTPSGLERFIGQCVRGD
ncbi:thioredoxin family protein [Sutterella sp.]|uniref:thioredoxin family protein n=1 Tax=Sutterella sp. TaxID=1981025 RepID=UPI0026E10CC3|nr:thioredoxin family protein [Sutterella sp.]MDO5530656.1 thioredoxin family protein [Sutterella sp.]